MGVSHYQSLFRRARTGERRQGFTRDYLQASGIMPVLREMFPGQEPPYEPLLYRWGAGVYTNGRIYPAADFSENERVDVGQFLGGIPPEPWQIGDPLANPTITLPGDPGAAIPDEAIAQWNDQIEPLEPWLMMIQLEQSQQELQIRAYLGNPPPELQGASLDHVPQSLREIMAGSRVGAGAIALGVPELWFEPSDFRNPWRLNAEGGPQGPSVVLAPISPTTAGAEYRVADEEVESAAPEPFEIDPNQRDRATREHNATQNALAEVVRERGLEPLSPSGEPDFDLAWEEADGTLIVAEVKSITPRNVERQLRLGLGQVLRYRSLLQETGKEVRALLALSGKPHDERWQALCAELEVGLIWLPDLGPALNRWLSGGEAASSD
jgi:hypothetical protein